MEIYVQINNLADYIIQGYMANQLIEDKLINLEDILHRNDVYLSKKMCGLYYEIYDDMGGFSDILDEIKILKKNLGGDTDDDKLYQKETEKDELRIKIGTDLKKIKKTIREEYQSD